jgi:hypothetical protein
LQAIKDTRRANDDIVINAIRDMGTSSSDSTRTAMSSASRRCSILTNRSR